MARGSFPPFDGCVVGLGTIDAGTIVQVKGTPLSVDRLVNGRRASDGGSDEDPDEGPDEGHLGPIPTLAFEGGRYLTLFLRPRGYHYVHAPDDSVVDEVRWIPGRFFPQNEDALRHIPRILRTERARGSSRAPSAARR